MRIGHQISLPELSFLSLLIFDCMVIFCYRSELSLHLRKIHFVLHIAKVFHVILCLLIYGICAVWFSSFFRHIRLLIFSFMSSRVFVILRIDFTEYKKKCFLLVIVWFHFYIETFGQH